MIRAVGASIVDGWQKDSAEKTDLTELSAFFRIQNGQAATDNFKLIGPLVRVTGAGTADLGAKTLQFRVEPKVVLSLQGQGGFRRSGRLRRAGRGSGAMGLAAHLSGVGRHPGQSRRGLCQAEGDGRRPVGLRFVHRRQAADAGSRLADGSFQEQSVRARQPQTPGPSATSPEPPPQAGTDKLQDIMKGLFGR